MNKVLFVYKDKEQKTVLNWHEYTVTDNIKCEILSEYPQIEEIEGQYGYYSLDEEGNVIVKYTELPKTEVELLKLENEALEERLCAMQELVATILFEKATGEEGEE